MKELNHVYESGIIRKIETKTISANVELTTFNLTKRTDSKGSYVPEFFTLQCELWNCKPIANRLADGKWCVVMGYLKPYSWTVGDDKRHRIVVVAENIQILEDVSRETEIEMEEPA